MKNQTRDTLNSFIKTKQLSEFDKYKTFIKKNDLEEKEIINIIIIDGQFWASITYESFYQSLMNKNDYNIETFIPFILIPLKLNSTIENINLEGIVSYKKYNSLKIEAEINEGIFFIKNYINDDTEDDEKINLFDIDRDFRESILCFSKKDKKEIINQIREEKAIDIYNQFHLSNLLGFIEKKLEKYILDTSNHITISFLQNDIYQDLSTTNIKKEIDNSPISFKITEESIRININ